jgi:hypothetical protein
MQRSTTSARRAVVLGAVLLGCLVAAPGCGWMVARPAPAVEGTDEFGTFQRVEGVGVLTLHGTPYQRGLAHGRLLAQPIIDTVDAVCGTHVVTGRTRTYESTILPLMDRFAFTPDEEQELQGIADGVHETLGERAILPWINRPLTVRDLKAYNTVGDWYRQACSSLAAWGSLTKDGHVWVGRNFDFVPSATFFTHQMVIVHRPLGDKKAWATVAAPGMIGCITGLNAEGVFTSTHDVYLPVGPLGEGYVPRLILLRRLMEQVSARDLETQALPIFRSGLHMFDQTVMLAAPVKDGTPPALIFECGPERKGDGVVTVRRPGDSESLLRGEGIATTNHFRKRDGPRFDMAYLRYPLLVWTVAQARIDKHPVDREVIADAMRWANLPLTMHTVVVDLDTLDFWYAGGDFLQAPDPHKAVRLPMKEWLSAK